MKNMASANKDHWYDGLFYDIFIAPNQDNAFNIIKPFIAENSTVCDVGCGTGRFAFKFKDNFRKIDGLDFSKRNIDRAEKNLLKNPSDKINFYHSDAVSFFQSNNKHYDYALISFVIHEIKEKHREKILKVLSESADNVIVIDYLYPRPLAFWTFQNEAVEFFAGMDHYRNYKTYLANKGIKGLAEKTGLKIVNEIQNKPATSHIVVLTK